MSVAVAALNAQIDPALYRRGIWPARIAAASMLVAAVRDVRLGNSLLLTSDASLFWSANGMFSTSLALNWFAFVVVAVAATLVALRTARELRTEVPPRSASAIPSRRRS